MNIVLVGDHGQGAIRKTREKQDADPIPYIDGYQTCLNSLVKSSELTTYDNECFTSYTNTKHGYYIIVPKTSSLLRFYQRLLPGTNVLVYFVNINEQKNYSLETLKQCEKSNDASKLHESYQLFQKLMIGIPQFVYPPKYICLVFCGAQSKTQFNENIVKFIKLYYLIIIDPFVIDKINMINSEFYQRNVFRHCVQEM